MSFENKVVIVTGGAAGIGKGIAECFAMERANVVIADWNAEDGEAVKIDLESRYGIQAMFVKMDASSEEDARKTAEAALNRWGQIDVLVNNVGTHLYKQLLEFRMEEWDRLMAVDLRSCFLMARSVLPNMISRGHGSIVNISSIHANQSEPLYTAYAAAKGGVVALTRSMAAEYASSGIRVNAVLPGLTRNKAIDEQLSQCDEGERRKTLARWGKAVPLGRIADPVDIGHSVVFLASDKAAYITGASLTVDGGLTSTLKMDFE